MSKKTISTKDFLKILERHEEAIISNYKEEEDNEEVTIYNAILISPSYFNDISKITFKKCDFTVINTVTFVDCNFVNCNFTESIKNTTFKNCNFTNCKIDTLIENTTFDFGSILSCDFSISRLINTIFNKNSIVNCNFFRVDLIKSYFIDLTDNRYNLFLSLQCPEEGAFIGYKKLCDKSDNEFICKLLIPREAKRSSATTRKCRCSMAKVLEIINIKTNIKVEKVEHIICSFSSGIKKVIYKTGKYVYSDSWDENRWNEYGDGISFFITKEEVMNYCSI